MSLKESVQQHWENEVCGIRYGDFQAISEQRYQNHPVLLELADFPSGKGKDVLEIGLGTGADFENWLNHGARATGIELTSAAIATTRERLAAAGFRDQDYTLMQGDAEALPYEDDAFDIVYSFGVLHHTPDTPTAISEAVRVLKPGGELKLMVYHVPSWSAWMVWALHGPLKGRFISPRTAVFRYLESPGTKCYTQREMYQLLADMPLQNVSVWSKLSPADLLIMEPSGKYDTAFFRFVRAVYPRKLVRLLGDRFGMNLLVTARKASITP